MWGKLLHSGFVEDIETPLLTRSDWHFLHRALRVKNGDLIRISDGISLFRTCRFGDSLRVIDQPQAIPRHPRTIRLAFGLSRAYRPELVIDKLSEVGVDEVYPCLADRSYLEWDDERCMTETGSWQTISRRAVMRVGGLYLPALKPTVAYRTLLRNSQCAILYGTNCDSLPSDHVVCVGVDEGWSEDERADARLEVDLGVGHLRSESMALAAAYILASGCR